MRTVQIPLICLGSVMALAALAVAQEEDLDDLYEFDVREAEAGEAGAGVGESDREAPLESGFVFIDGEFVAAPYDVTLSEDGDQVLINGREVPGAIPASPPGVRSFGGRLGGRDAGGRWRGFGRNRSAMQPPGHMWAARIRRHLDDNLAIVAFTGQRLSIVQDAKLYALLRSLMGPQREMPSESVTKVMEIPAGADAAALWKQWLVEFRPDAAFRRQAEPVLAMFETAEAENRAEIAAVRRFDAVAYPLTLLGMLMSVIAFGHLLMSLPNNDAMRRGTDSEGGISRDVIRATMISVVLVAALSSLDLVWTLLASQAGQMQELNPIASHFINDPLSLIAFKSAATLLGCGLLFALRRHSRAQLASWWMCLICTMLTFRWLVFNSMFVT